MNRLFAKPGGLALLALLLLFLCALSTRASAQTPTVVVVAPNTASADGGNYYASYPASLILSGPAVNSEQKIVGTTYLWSNGDTGDSTTVTDTEGSAGDFLSTVSCTVTWNV